MNFAWIARRSDVTNATIDDKDDGNDAGDADNPLNSIGDEGVAVYAFASGAAGELAVCAEQGKTDATHDDISRHDNGETDESLGEGFFAGGDFAGIASGEDIEVAAVDDVAEYEVSGDDGDVGEDVDSDERDAVYEGVLIGNGDATVP